MFEIQRMQQREGWDRKALSAPEKETGTAGEKQSNLGWVKEVFLTEMKTWAGFYSAQPRI